jgi:hypothetical protein
MNRKLNSRLLATSTNIAASQASSAANIDSLSKLDITCVIAGNNPSNVTFDTGTMAVHTLTFPTLAGAVDGDYVTFYDQAGTAWAAALDTTGGAANTPTGAAWTAIAAGNKVEVDISGATTAADVAALVETDIDGMTGFTAVITSDDTAADGTMTLTQIVPGTVTLGNDYSKTGAAGTGTTLAIASTTTGVATEVSVSGDSVTVPSHGLTTGVKITELTTTGTLPAGLSLSTVYYAIVVDDNTLQFATSQANATAGTAVTITDYGATTSVHTISINTTLAGTVILQKNNNPEGVAAEWVSLIDGEIQGAATASNTISAAATFNWSVPDCGAREIRALITITSGTVTGDVRILHSPV